MPLPSGEINRPLSLGQPYSCPLSRVPAHARVFRTFALDSPHLCADFFAATDALDYQSITKVDPPLFEGDQLT